MKLPCPAVVKIPFKNSVSAFWSAWPSSVITLPDPPKNFPKIRWEIFELSCGETDILSKKQKIVRAIKVTVGKRHGQSAVRVLRYYTAQPVITAKNLNIVVEHVIQLTDRLSLTWRLATANSSHQHSFYKHFGSIHRPPPQKKYATNMGRW